MEFMKKIDIAALILATLLAFAFASSVIHFVRNELLTIA